MYNYRPSKRNQQQQMEKHEQGGDDNAAPELATSKSSLVKDDSGNSKQFANAKRQVLVQKIDRSKKGELDELAQPLSELINADARYYTTSSCSGRLTVGGWTKILKKVIATNVYVEKKHKKHFRTLFEKHEAGDHGDAIVDVLDKEKTLATLEEFECLELKFEPLILHVRAVNLEAATALLQVALQSGFRHSGIITSTGATDQSSCIVTIRHTLQMEVPLVVNGQLVVTDQYILKLVKVANDKFAENEKAIAHLEDNIRAKLFMSTE